MARKINIKPAESAEKLFISGAVIRGEEAIKAFLEDARKNKRSNAAQAALIIERWAANPFPLVD